MKKQLLIASLLAVASTAMAENALAPATTPSAKPGLNVAPSAATRPDGVTMAKRQLERFDANKDGKVTLNEFLDPARESFKKIDTNKDGVVTAEELAESQKRQMEEFQKMRAANAGQPGRLAQPGKPVEPSKPILAPAAPAK